MIHMQIEPLGISVDMEKGKTIREGLEQIGIRLDSPCGGLGSCGGCGVWVQPAANVPPTPHKNISSSKAAEGFRLACMAVPEGDITIRRMDHYAYDRKPLDQGDRILLHRGGGTGKPAGAGEKRQGKGLAIDIGTTTLVLLLVDLETGEIMASEAGLNPQAANGYDVVSRIHYAGTDQHRQEMAALVQDTLNRFIRDACAKASVRAEEIIDICIGANTTMLQMAAGMDCASIGRSPFNFSIKGGTDYPASLFGLHVNEAARVYLPPILHAFVGTDISAGLLLCPEFFDGDKVVLFIDMGTNGEMCLNVRGNWFTTSTAAGPAFEGMGLSSGMRAADGAVEKVEFTEGKLRFATIGGKPVKGICGSGIIDFLAVLLRAGFLENSGRMAGPETLGPYGKNMDGQPVIQYGEGVYLTQKDIRQLQLAKGAVRTGIDMILKKGGIDGQGLDRIYLAGGFGNYLNPFNLEAIKLLPAHTADKIVFCGNTSIEGAALLLTDVKKRRLLESRLGGMVYVELAALPEFNTAFVANLDF
ncbi:MAG: ASKHA domain-containing protein [Desulfobacula sp.]|nr:ASKHA domain-containing protein [Desulfobacula sp.]